MWFINSPLKAYLEPREPISTWKSLCCRKYSLQKLTQYSQGNNVVDAPVSAQMIFFWDIHVFVRLSLIAYLEHNENFFALKTLIGRKYSFQKLSKFSKGNNVLDALASDTNGFLLRTHVFLQLSWKCLLEMNIASLHLEKTMLLEVFLSKRTQFSQGNNVVDAAASNRDRFLSQDICVSSTQLKRPIWNKYSLSSPWES
jgi:hypothetical protein